MNMNKEGESHAVPAIVAIIGIIATLVLIYLILSISASFIFWLLGGPSGGTPAITFASKMVDINSHFFA